jgi:hypothetical protein
MTNQTRDKAGTLRTLTRGVAVAMLAASLALGASGCTKKKKPAPPPPPPPKPKVVTPDPVDVNGLLQALKSDERVKFPEGQAPADRSLAEGVIKLANALAKGDADGMKPLLDKPAAEVLDTLTASGGWAAGTKPIEQVRIIAVSGTTEAHPETSLIGMAVQDQDGAYLLAWNGKRNGESWLFTNAPCQADIKPRASDFDGVSIEGGAASAPAEETKTETAPKADKPEDKAPPPEPDKPAGPKKKSTPVGPVTIPGSG